MTAETALSQQQRPVTAAFASRYAVAIAATSLFAVSLLLYTLTMAPGLTWENKGGDGGDFLAAAHTWGIPHPTGYPTYIVLLRVFSELVPVGDEALRGNLMSALFGAATVPVFFLAARKLLLRLPLADTGGRRLPFAVAVVAALAFATGNLHWSQSTITEVYTLNAFFVATLLWLMLVARARIERGESALPLRTGTLFLLGVALGNHVTTSVVIAPFLVWLYWPLAQRERWRLAREWQPVAAFITGLAIYIYAPIASAQDPALNWFFPNTLTGFRMMASATIYQPYVFGVRPDFLYDRVIASFELWLTQYTLVGAILGLAGVMFLWGRLRGFTAASIVSVLALAVYTISYSSFDSYVFLIPVFMVFALWIAAGLLNFAATMKTAADSGKSPFLARQKARIAPAVLGVALVAMPVWSLAFNYSGVDISSDTEAQDYMAFAMDAAGQGGVIIAEDIPTFGLWHYSLVVEPEQDVMVVATFLLGFDWYWDHLQRQFPGKMPAEMPATWSARLQAIAAHNFRAVPVLLTHGESNYAGLFQLEERGDLWEVVG